MFAVMLEAAKDYRTDASLNEWCHKDTALFCTDVEPVEGHIQDCLVRIRIQSMALHPFCCNAIPFDTEHALPRECEPP